MLSAVVLIMVKSRVGMKSESPGWEYWALSINNCGIKVGEFLNLSELHFYLWNRNDNNSSYLRELL